MWAMLNRKAKVTGSTLNGKKEKLQAEEGDKEKWDFLSFAEAWTPNESLEEIKNEVLFTHFEKEKQHDIRAFFSPKPSTEKKRKIDSWDKSLNFTLGDSKVTPAKHIEEGSRHLDAREIIDVDAVCYENGCEPEAKRPRAISTPSQSSSSKKKRKTLPGKTNSLFTKETDNEFSGDSLPNSRKKSPLAKAWCCSLCTYTNNLLLPYCEICECPRGSDGNEGENAPQDSRKIKGIAVRNTDNGRKDLVQTATESSDEIGGEVANAVENGSEEWEQKPQEGHVDNSDTFPVYDVLNFCASRNTDRIHLYTKDGKSLNCNFIPLDIKLDNWEDLPENFQQKQNLGKIILNYNNLKHFSVIKYFCLILRFVREWSSLTAMKQKIIRKSGNTFCSPILAAEEISKQQARLSSTKRYVTKEDVAVASLSKANSSGGSVCLVTKETALLLKDGKVSSVLNTDSVQAEVIEGPAIYKGYLQAVDNKGNPLCLSCQKPTVHLDQHCKSIAWETRFCSLKCQEDFLIRSSQSYLRSKVFEVEHGVCQLCNLNSQELYLSIRNAPKSQRKSLLESSWMSQLPLGQLNEIITNPTEGQFWQVDHIKPVYNGGGQCSLENLQTLCTVCHKERTAKQAKERSQMKRHSLASKYGSDITKFFIKM
uniref:RanBP2-type domain-containing protein n=1 Tax=Chelonoidis abingdonii TaxID=106734 RepID=A0A8C0H5A4_CHEAB